MVQPSLLEAAFLSGIPEAVAEQLQGQSHLGREHFIAFGQLVLTPPAAPLARTSFSILVARRAYPKDKRKVDFASYGLEIVPRADVGLGRMPDFASFAVSAETGAQANYAVGTDSLALLIGTEAETNPSRSLILGPSTLRFLTSLTEGVNGQKRG